MKKIVITILMFALSLAAGPLYAIDNPGASKHPIDEAYDQAVEKDSSTMGMVKASSDAEKQWDDELNKYYKLLTGKLDKKAQQSIKKAQLAWIKFRDAEFELIAEVYSKMDGTMYRVIAAGLRAEVVKKRALDLKNLYEECFSEK